MCSCWNSPGVKWRFNCPTANRPPPQGGRRSLPPPAHGTWGHSSLNEACLGSSMDTSGSSGKMLRSAAALALRRRGRAENCRAGPQGEKKYAVPHIRPKSTAEKQWAKNSTGKNGILGRQPIHPPKNTLFNFDLILESVTAPNRPTAET